MKYQLNVEAVIEADPAAVWQAWTDTARFPGWGPREEENRLDGPFAAGTSGWSKQRGIPGGPYALSVVNAQQSWEIESPLPGGKLTVDHRVQVLDGGRVRVSKQYAASGPMSLAFRLHFGRKIRQSMPDSFAALATEAARLHAEART
jgi:hypothetical protein